MAAVFFRMLGPLDVLVDDREVPLGGLKPRVLLATLLLRPNVPVSKDKLIEILWPRRAPASAEANIRTYVHFLRQQLLSAGSEPSLHRVASGYLLDIAAGEVDAALFERHITDGQQALTTGDHERALALLGSASDLWRGDPLADVPHSVAWEPTIARLEELRLGARELLLRTRFELGGRADVVASLRELVTLNPLREELWAQLIEALARSDRHAEARVTYEQAERVLRAEADVAPGQVLREALQRQNARVSRGASSSLCQLPLDLPDFTGREDHINALLRLIESRRAGGTPTVAALSGPPGVGKSAVAIRVAHTLGSSFSDGQLLVDLGGTSASPRKPVSVLAELLRRLGIPDVDIPRDRDERSAMFRARLADANLCVVLDDAADAAQVRPLLPGAGTSVVIVTSRHRLSDLAGAHCVELPVLSEQEAANLFERLVGPDRVRSEPEAARVIQESCGHLPLALRVAGSKLAQRQSWTLGMFAARLADERRRLDVLRTGDLAVRASVSLSYEQLPVSAARAFRGLSTLGPIQFPAWVVAATLNRPDAEDVLDVLVDTHLVELVTSDVTGRPRYRLHDLLRCYAAERATEDDPATQRDVVRCVLEGYLSLARAAVARLPIRFFGVLPPAEAGWRPADRDDLVHDATAWFEAEHQAGVAAVDMATAWRLDDLAWQIACAFQPYYDLRNHRDDWMHTHELALAAATRAGSALGEATVLRSLGQLQVYQDDYDASAATMARSLKLFGEAGDRHGAAYAFAGLGTAERMQGHNIDALARYGEALQLLRSVADPHGEAAMLLSIGSTRLVQGDDDAAESYFSEAGVLASRIGDTHREATVLYRHAALHVRRGRLDAAREMLDRAIAIFDGLRDENCSGYARQSLGELSLLGGDLDAAGDLLEAALTVHRHSGDRRGQLEANSLLSNLHDARHEPDLARHYHDSAQALRRELPAEMPAY